MEAKNIREFLQSLLIPVGSAMQRMQQSIMMQERIHLDILQQQWVEYRSQTCRSLELPI